MWKRIWGPNLVTKADRLSTHAAALAFTFVLSLVPFLVVTFTLGSFLSPLLNNLGSSENLQQSYDNTYTAIIKHLLPNMSNDDVAVILNTVQRTSLSVENGHATRHWLAFIGFTLAFYTTFNFMMQFVRTLNFIFDDVRRPMTTLLYSVKSILLMLIWMALLVIICLCFIFTPVVANLFTTIPIISLLRTPIIWGSNLVAFAALFGAFYLTYILVPLRHYRKKIVLHGALVSSLGWIICGIIFSKVLPGIWNYNAVYGALGSVVVILVWGQTCAWSVIAGACWIVRFSPTKAPGSTR